VLRGAMRDGSLERIFRKWNVWNADQPKLHASCLAGQNVPAYIDSGDDQGLDASAGTATLSGWRLRGVTFPRC
jgi:hypothetical protein